VDRPHRLPALVALHLRVSVAGWLGVHLD
jgi:hypothetical protein